MGKLLGGVGALVSYCCVASIITLVGGAAYLRSSGQLSDEKMAQVLAAAQGVSLAAPHVEPAKQEEDKSTEQPSFDEREHARELIGRQLEMREQALKTGVERIRFEQRELTEEKERYLRLKTAFDEQLASLRDGALLNGRENVRLIWEHIKPKQAKEQIMQMLEDQEITEVVSILSTMPIAKRAKIVAEFKTPEEAAKLGEILRLIRQGVPEVNLIDKTRSQISSQAK